MSPQLQQRLRRAAQIQDRSLSDFVLTAASEAADKVIEEAETISVSRAAYEQLRAALENPPEPNEALKRAFRTHNELFGSVD